VKIRNFGMESVLAAPRWWSPTSGRAAREGGLKQPARRSGSTRLTHSRNFKLFGLAALLALAAGCESDGGGYGGDVNFYGSVGYYDGFYDPWYGGGGGVIVSPPDRPIAPSRPTVTPHMSGGGRRR
jgi:hypothetical protein